MITDILSVGRVSLSPLCRQLDYDKLLNLQASITAKQTFWCGGSFYCFRLGLHQGQCKYDL